MHDIEIILFGNCSYQITPSANLSFMCILYICGYFFLFSFKYNIVHVNQTINLIMAVEIVSFLLNNYVHP